MAIDPYEPELAKRQAAFQIASKRLTELVDFIAVSLAHQGRVEAIDKFVGTEEALRDYTQSSQQLSEWLAQKN